MADAKISQLTSATTPLAGTEVVPVVQSGSTKKVTVANLTLGRDVRSKNLIATGQGVFSGPLDNFWSTTGALYGYYSGGVGVFASYSDASGTLAQLQFDGSLVNFKTGNTARLTLSAAGNATVNTGNLVIGTAGKGIDFSANTNAAGMTSELLADYEEGTWTPTISGSSTAGEGTYPARTGVYVKIGNLVTVTAYINISNHTGTGNILLSNLPFTAFATSDVYFPVTIGYLNNCALNANSYPMGFLTFNTTSIALQQNITGGGSMVGVPMDTAFSIMYTVTYRVA